MRNSAGVRLRRATWRQLRSYSKRQATKQPKAPRPISLSRQSLGVMRKYWRQLVPVMFIYGLLAGIFGSAWRDIYHNAQVAGGDLTTNGRSIGRVLGGFGSLFGSAGSSGSRAGVVINVILILLLAFTTIWILRRALASKPAPLMEGLYNSTAQLVPFILVLVAIAISLAPLVFALVLLDSALSPDIEAWGVILFSLISIALTFASFYTLTGWLLAPFVATLPRIKPWASLRSAANLARFKRWQIFNRFVGLLLIVAIVMGVLVVPSMLYAQSLVAPVFFVMALLTFVFGQTYLYSLYRSLIK